jgi:hypothetical protein
MTRKAGGARFRAMKSVLFLTALLILGSSSAARAARFEVRGYGPVFAVDTASQSGESIASLTRTVLKRAKETGLIRDFSFSDIGLDSITPLGQAPLGFFLEEIREDELRAYGWCYSVDGIAPDLLADEYVLTGSEKVIAWFFGFASRIGGNWETQCRPVFTP